MSTASNILGGAGTLFKELTAAGITPANAFTTVQSLATGSSTLQTSLLGMAQQMVVNEGNSAALTGLATDIAKTIGATPIVIDLANAAVGAAGNPVSFMMAIGELETAIKSL